MSAMYGVGNFVGPALGGLCAQLGSWRLAFGVAVEAFVPRDRHGQGRGPSPLTSGTWLVSSTA
jgi:hypothetical protein